MILNELRAKSRGIRETFEFVRSNGAIRIRIVHLKPDRRIHQRIQDSFNGF
jgi:hypothetical protein